ncbi:MAG: PilZ domain-containing protein [Kofleriaceae bacterium]
MIHLPERRTDVRIELKGTAKFHVGEHSQNARIANISIGGVLAMTTVTAPEHVLGRAVDLEIRLDTMASEWLQLHGKITRIDAVSVAIAFDAVAPSFVRLLDELSTASNASRRVVSVVLIDATPARRYRVAEAFRAVGCTVLEVATPLEAIVRLGELRFEPNLIAIADSMPSTTSEEMRTWVEREHPLTKLVTIGDHLTEPDGIAHWLSSADPESDLASRVRTVLLRSRLPI